MSVPPVSVSTITVQLTSSTAQAGSHPSVTLSSGLTISNTTSAIPKMLVPATVFLSHNTDGNSSISQLMSTACPSQAAPLASPPAGPATFPPVFLSGSSGVPQGSTGRVLSLLAPGVMAPPEPHTRISVAPAGTPVNFLAHTATEESSNKINNSLSRRPKLKLVKHFPKASVSGPRNITLGISPGQPLSSSSSGGSSTKKFINLGAVQPTGRKFSRLHHQLTTPRSESVVRAEQPHLLLKLRNGSLLFPQTEAVLAPSSHQQRSSSPVGEIDLTEDTSQEVAQLLPTSRCSKKVINEFPNLITIHGLTTEKYTSQETDVSTFFTGSQVGGAVEALEETVCDYESVEQQQEGATEEQGEVMVVSQDEAELISDEQEEAQSMLEEQNGAEMILQEPAPASEEPTEVGEPAHKFEPPDTLQEDIAPLATPESDGASAPPTTATPDTPSVACTTETEPQELKTAGYKTEQGEDGKDADEVTKSSQESQESVPDMAEIKPEEEEEPKKRKFKRPSILSRRKRTTPPKVKPPVAAAAAAAAACPVVEEPSKAEPAAVDMSKQPEIDEQLIKPRSDNIDPEKLLDWQDGVAQLTGSDLKFKMNEFGLLEMVEEETAASSSQESNPAGTKKRARKEKLFTDDLYCCENCGSYGTVLELTSRRFCSVKCEAVSTKRRAAASKRAIEMEEQRLKRRRTKAPKEEPPAAAPVTGEESHPPAPAAQAGESKAVEGGAEEPVRSATPASSTAQSTPAPTPVPTPTPTPSDEEVLDPVSVATNTVPSVPLLPWQVLNSEGLPQFTWTKYLEHLKARPAPIKLFIEGYPYQRNGFRPGMKLEGIDPKNPSQICALSIIDIKGYRMKLHFDGWPETHDFWLNADSRDIFPVGFCEKSGRCLVPPRGYPKTTFCWAEYLKATHTSAAPTQLFIHRAAAKNSVGPSGFRLGMKLEAVDRQHKSLVCVATVADILAGRILIHFDSWDRAYDYWVEPTSPYIHPIGWCQENNKPILPPQGVNPADFDWEKYLTRTKTLAVPSRAFKPKPSPAFKRGMKLECVDPRFPELIRVASIQDCKDHRLLVSFDGWPLETAVWLESDWPDIHPTGWCAKTNHPLTPPPSPNVEHTCVTPGCRALLKNSQFILPHSSVLCPLSSVNLERTQQLPMRVFRVSIYKEGGRPEPNSLLCDETLDEEEAAKKIEQPAPKKKTQSKKKVRKDESRTKNNESGTKSSESGTKSNESGSKGNESVTKETPPADTPKPPAGDKGEKASSPSEEVSRNAQGETSSKNLRGDVHLSVFNPDYSVSVQEAPVSWAKKAEILKMDRVLNSKTARSWGPSEVERFVSSLPGCAERSNIFLDEKIDGESLLLLTQSDLINELGFKVGPAIKLYNSIALLNKAKLPDAQ